MIWYITNLLLLGSHLELHFLQPGQLGADRVLLRELLLIIIYDFSLGASAFRTGLKHMNA